MIVACIICFALAHGVLKSNNSHVDSPARSTKAASTEEASTTDGPDPFYGVWCYSSKDMDVAQSKADELSRHGLDGNVYISNEWSNLNKERWYCVSAGKSLTEADAEKVLDAVRNAGYSDAYIRYSGEYIG